MFWYVAIYSLFFLILTTFIGIEKMLQFLLNKLLFRMNLHDLLNETLSSNPLKQDRNLQMAETYMFVLLNAYLSSLSC